MKLHCFVSVLSAFFFSYKTKWFLVCILWSCFLFCVQCLFVFFHSFQKTTNKKGHSNPLPPPKKNKMQTKEGQKRSVSAVVFTNTFPTNVRKVESKICPSMLRNIIGQILDSKMVVFVFFLCFFLNLILLAERTRLWKKKQGKKGTIGQIVDSKKANCGQIFDSTVYIYIVREIHSLMSHFSSCISHLPSLLSCSLSLCRFRSVLLHEIWGCAKGAAKRAWGETVVQKPKNLKLTTTKNTQPDSLGKIHT